VRTRAGGESSLARDVRGAVREVDPSLPLYDVRTMNEHIETNLIFRRVPARMFVVLGPLLLLLAATGIYAVAAYTVSQRTTEIGVRIALGATGTRVAAQLARDTMRSICLGALGGWALTLIVTMDLLRTRPISVAVFAGIPIALLLVSAAACWIPARRASRLDPLVALRYDA
jgi:ABC-type antimicrobial peptide transport system permease subunit